MTGSSVVCHHHWTAKQLSLQSHTHVLYISLPPNSTQCSCLLLCLCRTVIGLRCKDGVVLGVEKPIISKMLEKGADRRTYAVDTHAGVVSHCMLDTPPPPPPKHTHKTQTFPLPAILSEISKKKPATLHASIASIGGLALHCLCFRRLGNGSNNLISKNPLQAVAGLSADGRQIVNRAIDEASQYRK